MLMMMVVVMVSHAGEFPDERAKGAGDGLPFAGLDWLGWNVGANWRESIHSLVKITG